MQKTKIFGIGLQKTGTSTLGRALNILGYNVDERTAYDLMEAVVEENYEGLLKKRVSEFDGFEDTPWPALYKQLDEWYPGSIFILTVRDETGWINSMVKHFGNKPNDFKNWFYGQPAPLGNENMYKAKYNQHNKEVKEYFKNRSSSLLVLDFERGDGWKELCDFLDKPIPDEAFPHLNKNKTIWDKLGHKFRGGTRKVKKIIRSLRS